MKVRCVNNLDCGDYVVVGKLYNVYGMMVWEKHLHYLLSEGPYWYSAEQFEVIDHLLPVTWYFSFKEHKDRISEEPLMAIWGYKEIITDHKHRVALIEGDKSALEIFQKRKEEIDEYEELRSFKSE